MKLQQLVPNAARPNIYVGAPIERSEDLRFLRGRGTYLDDLSRPGQWHAAFVRSPRAHGTIRSIAVENALRCRGVHAILTRADRRPDWCNIQS
jgi:carbon-monoxide dehydrogenase large subunit